MNMRSMNLRDASAPKPSKEAKDAPILSNTVAKESYATGSNKTQEYVNSSSGVKGPFGAKGKN